MLLLTAIEIFRDALLLHLGVCVFCFFPFFNLFSFLHLFYDHQQDFSKTKFIAIYLSAAVNQCILLRNLV